MKCWCQVWEVYDSPAEWGARDWPGVSPSPGPSHGLAYREDLQRTHLARIIDHRPLRQKVLYYQVLRVPIIQFISNFYLVEVSLPHYQDPEQQTPTEARQSWGIPCDLLSHHDIHIAWHSHQVSSGQSLHCCKSEIGFYAPGSGVVTGGSEVIKCRQESSPESIEDEVAFQWVCFIKSGQNRNIYQVGTLNPRFSGKKTNNLLQFRGNTQEMVFNNTTNLARH